nr:ras-related protein Rab-20 isoform X2 [Dasypus novemcinctus]
MVWQERRKAKRTSQQLSVFNSHAILSIKLRSPNPGQKARIASPATRTLSSGRKEVTQILAKKQTPARGRAGEGRRGGVGRPGRAPGLRRRGARGVRAAGAGGARGVRGGQGSPTWAPGRVSRPRPSALENALPLPSSWASGGEVPAGRPRASTARGLRGAGCPAPRAGVAPLRLGGPRGRAASRSCRCASRRRAGRAPGRGRARGAARRPGKLASGKMRKPDGKIVLLGDMNVGKTSLLHRYMERRFPDTVSTVGGAFYLKQWRSYNISIWDTADNHHSLVTILRPLGWMKCLLCPGLQKLLFSHQLPALALGYCDLHGGVSALVGTMNWKPESVCHHSGAQCVPGPLSPGVLPSTNTWATEMPPAQGCHEWAKCWDEWGRGEGGSCRVSENKHWG